MSGIRLLAWKKGATAFNQPRRWDIELGEEGATFRETDGARTIFIPVRHAAKIEILGQPFGLGPDEVRRRPTIVVKENAIRWHHFGLAHNGTAQLREWLTKHLPKRTWGGSIIIRSFPILRQHIEAVNADIVQDLIDAGLIELKRDGQIQPWIMSIDGYNVDPRPIWRIPEVRAWYAQVHAKYPHLPLFLMPASIKAYALCVADIVVARQEKRKNISDTERVIIEMKATEAEKKSPGSGATLREALESKDIIVMRDPDEVQSLLDETLIAGIKYLAANGFAEPAQERILKEVVFRFKQAVL
jgi:hypothetical protein